MSFFASLLGGGIIKSLENVALEAITTDKESAEAKTLVVKALDPNGKMRRDLSRFACWAYGFYLVATTILIFMSVWGLGGDICSINGDMTTCVSRADTASERMTALFFPITTSWAAIVSASFGVNGVNSYKGQ